MSHASTVEEVRVDAIRPNDHNPKAPLSEAERAALRRGIERLGFAQAVTVAPDGPGRFVIVDGEDRWRAACDVGLEAVPCLVLEGYEDAELKLLTVQLNEVRGENDPAKRRGLLADIEPALGLLPEDLAALLALPVPDWHEAPGGEDADAPEAPSGGPSVEVPHLKEVKLYLTPDAYEVYLHEMDALADGFDLMPDRFLALLKKIREEIGWDAEVLMEVGLRVLAARGARSESA